MNKLIGFFIVAVFAFQTILSQEIDTHSKKTLDYKLIELNWSSTFKKALKKSKKEKKPVLIYFTGSDWCGPCKILDDKLFHTKKFKTLADKNLILLEVDIPRRKDLVAPAKLKENLYLQKKYRVKAFPTLMMVNHRGKKIEQKKGYLITEYYYPFFESVINKY